MTRPIQSLARRLLKNEPWHAIVLDHEETDEETRCGYRQQKPNPVAVRGQGHHADDPADPIIGETTAEK